MDFVMYKVRSPPRLGPCVLNGAQTGLVGKQNQDCESSHRLASFDFSVPVSAVQITLVVALFVCSCAFIEKKMVTGIHPTISQIKNVQEKYYGYS